MHILIWNILFLFGTVLATGSAWAQVDAPIWERFGRNVHATHLDSVVFVKPDAVAPLPDDWARSVLEKIDMGDEAVVHGFFEQSLRRLGYTRTDVQAMGAKEAILLSIDVTLDVLDLYDNNDDPYEPNLDGLEPDQLDAFVHVLRSSTSYYPRSLDEVLEEGYGDCDDYAATTIAVFRWFKSFHPGLRHVYVTDNDLAGVMLGHAYNAFLVLGPGRLDVVYLDPHSYEIHGMGHLHGHGGDYPRDHFRAKPDEFLLDFYTGLFELKPNILLREEALANTSSSYTQKKLLIELIEWSAKSQDTEAMAKYVRAMTDQRLWRRDHLTPAQQEQLKQTTIAEKYTPGLYPLAQQVADKLQREVQQDARQPRKKDQLVQETLDAFRQGDYDEAKTTLANLDAMLEAQGSLKKPSPKAQTQAQTRYDTIQAIVAHMQRTNVPSIYLGSDPLGGETRIYPYWSDLEDTHPELAALLLDKYIRTQDLLQGQKQYLEETLSKLRARR
jgi:hypothetical protein